MPWVLPTTEPPPSPSAPPVTTDEGFDILPVGTQPPSADETLTLEDALAAPDVLVTDQNPPTPLGRAPAIDFAQRTFTPNTAGGPLMVYGTDTLRQWIEKCVRTRRGENPACDPDFGLDRLFMDMIDGATYDESAAAEFQAITERALCVHPAIDSIDGWSIDYVDGDDAAFVHFIVIKTAAGEDPLTVDVQLPATGAISA